MEDLSQVRDVLFGLESLLLDPVRRANPDCIANLFDEDFREFGKSGRTYDKAAILEFLRTENLPDRKVDIKDFKVTQITESAALVTYISVVEQARALRSSIWVAGDGGWRILFHQGTAACS